MQWLPVLRSLAAELAENVPAEKLRLMFFNVGGRLASDVESRFESVQTLAELENEINEFWLQLNWGWIHFSEQDGFININHQAAPLAESFGDDALSWSVGLLEGFYQALFKILGAGDGMTVRAIDGECADMQIFLRFGNHAA